MAKRDVALQSRVEDQRVGDGSMPGFGHQTENQETSRLPATGGGRKVPAS